MPAWVQAGFLEYQKRIQPMMSAQLIEIAPARRQKAPSAADVAKYQREESEKIKAAQKGKLWLLDVQGKRLSTEALADKLRLAMRQGDDVSFAIGGPDGVSDALIAHADFCWSLSDLTLPHPLARVVLMEQLYRALSLIHNHPYHRAN